MKPTPDLGRSRVTDIVDEIDENPAHFLSFTSALALSRIRRIDRIDVARAYIEVEAEFGQDRPDGLRSAIIWSLNHRIQELQETCERKNRLSQSREVDSSHRRARNSIWSKLVGRSSRQPHQGEFSERDVEP